MAGRGEPTRKGEGEGEDEHEPDQKEYQHVDDVRRRPTAHRGISVQLGCGAGDGSGGLHDDPGFCSSGGLIRPRRE